MSNHSSDSHSTSGHGSVKSYLIGFVLSVILTGVPFWMVMTHTFANGPTYITIIILAVIQILVHMKYFLHLNFSEEGKWDTYAIMFAAVIIIMVVGLSTWLMYAANAMMM
ncbi:cytochrome o ubiquinol oxidase subunit IV [Marinomonas spartinae]|uniref:cytochrome o ubiquinol oxidase subunit IV n=1 Tax=Marinomonas spartinae TaxID=1792290 RepID=UPI0018F26491|nr:cytochrome o ubiquinol oxidase subunit IV [Marinomonas spartinae]MBJ7553926.1 cytochrome o ubiquinol oxidase subunit IV [Marinomonas spartinae]